MRSEHVEQVDLIAWYDRIYGDGLLFAIPNGGKRHITTALKMKLEGVRKGVPDLFLPVARHGFHGLFIELKKAKGGTTSRDQKHWLSTLAKQGYAAYLCRGADAAKEAITDYLKGSTK